MNGEHLLTSINVVGILQILHTHCSPVDVQSHICMRSIRQQLPFPSVPLIHSIPREMKLTSPRLNLVIVAGAIVWYISAAVKAIPTEDPTTATVLCEVRRHEIVLYSGVVDLMY